MYDVFEKIEPVDRAYFRETFEARLGATLEDIAAKRDEFRPRFKSALADLEAVALGHEYLFEILPMLISVFSAPSPGSPESATEPLFDSAPSLGKWWERMQARFEV